MSNQLRAKFMAAIKATLFVGGIALFIVMFVMAFLRLGPFFLLAAAVLLLIVAVWKYAYDYYCRQEQ